MKIKSIEILINQPGTDRVFITTDLPSPFPSGVSNDTLIISFEAQHGKGIDYTLDNFGVNSVTVIDAKNGTKTIVSK